MAEDRHRRRRVRPIRRKRLGLPLASPVTTTLSSATLRRSTTRLDVSRDSSIQTQRIVPRSGGEVITHRRERMEERAGEVFSDLTRRAISISSSEGLSSPGGGVVDLTNDSGVEDELVDLTTSPVTSVAGLVGCMRERGRRRRRGGDVVVLDNESEDEVQIMEQPTEGALPHSNMSEPPSLDTSGASPVASPTKSLIRCPICMESAASFERRGAQVAVTTCGHVFCDDCIRRAIAEQRKCPTCRKRLTVRQMHPLYLSV